MEENTTVGNPARIILMIYKTLLVTNFMIQMIIHISTLVYLLLPTVVSHAGKTVSLRFGQMLTLMSGQFPLIQQIRIHKQRDVGPATKYTATRITNNEMSWAYTGWILDRRYYGTLNSPYSVMLITVICLCMKTRLLIRQSIMHLCVMVTAIGVEVDPNNLVIPTVNLNISLMKT